MVVLTLTNCSQGLRGDLTKWLLEIAPGVFVGRINARVRENLWKRVMDNANNGRAVMVHGTNSEQRLDFRVLGEAWEPIDFDGLKLILRPSISRLRQTREPLKDSFSNATKRRSAKKIAASRARLPTDYVVLDFETTGLEPGKDEIIAIGAMKVSNHQLLDTFNTLVKIERPIPQAIQEMTGITAEIVASSGEPLKTVLPHLLEFIGKLPVIAHNSDFELSFLRHGCSECGLPLFSNRCVDTLTLAKRTVKDVDNYKLSTLAKHFNFPSVTAHHPLVDCETTQKLYLELIKLLHQQLTE